MQKAFYGIAVAALLVLDRLFKTLALYAEASFGWGGVAEFRLFLNEGIAFSLPLSGPFVWVPSGVIILGAGFVALKDFRAKRADRLLPLLLFAGGAVSNLVDRIAYGYTVDYIIFFGRSAVNLADGMILLGAITLLRKKQPFC